ncbi:hypothetical protein AB0D08_38300, partial [Kitasatospora sp. NPDC048540]
CPSPNSTGRPTGAGSAARATAEQRLRRLLPDRPAGDSTDTDLPDWLTPSAAIDDPHTPADWAHHLTLRRDIIDRHLADRGAALAADIPAWAAPLGPLPPPEAGRALRDRWERTAALTDAWRTLHKVPAHHPGPGLRPETEQLAAAWDTLQGRIRALHHATRTAHHPHPAAAEQLTRQALDHLTRLRLLRTPHPAAGPQPATRAAGPNITGPAAVPVADAPAGRRPPAPRLLLPRAEHLAQDALAATLTSTAAPEAWIDQIPAPDEDDTAQQHLYLRLVAAVADWRLRHHITGTDPLGEAPEHDPGTEHRHLADALDLYRRARIDDRLQLLRLRREEDRQRLEAAAHQATTGPGSPHARPPRSGKPAHPRRGGRRRR